MSLVCRVADFALVFDEDDIDEVRDLGTVDRARLLEAWNSRDTVTRR